MGLAVVAFFFLPWLDRSKVKSIRYRGWLFRIFLMLFAISFVALGYLGLHKATPAYTNAARVFGAIYFLFFLLMPLYTKAYHAH
jgi:ubiquinol-cytochrome c reductase cytochrome b subunit